MRFRGPGRIAGTRASIEQLAVMLSDLRMNGQSILDRPVLDRTGLTGVYDFTLEWSPELSIFTAVQEELGLKLVVQPVEYFIVEQVSKPSGN